MQPDVASEPDTPSTGQVPWVAMGSSLGSTTESIRSNRESTDQWAEEGGADQQHFQTVDRRRGRSPSTVHGVHQPKRYGRNAVARRRPGHVLVVPRPDGVPAVNDTSRMPVVRRPLPQRVLVVRRPSKRQ